MAASVLAGARLMARADDSVTVWAVTSELAVGDTVSAEDLEARRVRFSDPDAQARYLLTSDELPAERHLIRGVGTGELLPRAALGAAAETGVLTVPLGLPATSVPPGVHAGSRVDVWVTSEGRGGRVASGPVLQDVVVIDAPRAADGFGATTDRQIVLGVDSAQETELAALLTAIGTDATITVVGRG